jgi:hypothetical protein
MLQTDTKQGEGNISNLRRGSLIAVVGAIVVTALSGPAGAQQAITKLPSAQPEATSAAGKCRFGRGLKGVPFSADEIFDTTRTLADGTQIAHRTLRKSYRDSEGRTREEFFGREGASQQTADGWPQFVLIFDPVACDSYRLEPRDHVAKESDPPRPAPQARPAALPRTIPQDVKQEELGEQEIEGVAVRGTRTTRTIPAGADGNDGPIEVVSEIWYSPELRRTVLAITSDPRNGDTTLRLTNIVRDEPPAALFQVPADYTIEKLTPVARPDTAPSGDQQ